jgi:hypothetical protein
VIRVVNRAVYPGRNVGMAIIVSTKTDLRSMETGIGKILCDTGANMVFTAMPITTLG